MMSDSSQNLCNETSFNSEDNDTKTIYPGKGWVWDYPKPKDGTKYSGRLMLSLVEFFHYVTFVTQLCVAYSYYYFSDFYSMRCASLFLVMMAPVFQGLAALLPVLMHEYEGWQIAQFKSPSEQHEIYNNDELRYATYKLLFFFQTVASLMFFVGVFGVDSWLGKSWNLLFIIAILVWLYIAPRVTKQPPFHFNGQSVFPVPIAILITFIPINLAYTFALIYILGGLSSLLPGLSIVTGYLVAGISEGLGAESTFDQRWHLLAVVLFSTAGMLQIFFVARHAMGLL